MSKREHIKTSPIERKKKKIINKNNNNKMDIDEFEDYDFDKNKELEIDNENIENIDYKKEYYQVKEWNEIVLKTYQEYNVTSINELYFALNYYNKVFLDENKINIKLDKQDYLLINYKKLENKIKSIKLKNMKKKYKKHCDKLKNIMKN